MLVLISVLLLLVRALWLTPLSHTSKSTVVYMRVCVEYEAVIALLCHWLATATWINHTLISGTIRRHKRVQLY